MDRRLRALVLALTLALGAIPAAAQVVTVQDLVNAARRGDSIGNLQAARPQLHAGLLRQLDRLNRPEARSLAISTVGRAALAAGDGPMPPLERIFRWRPRETVVGITAGEAIAVDSIAMIIGSAYSDLLTPILGEAGTDRLLAPKDSFDAAARRGSLRHSLEQLRRYERKFGPDAPRLNGVEVLLNYVAQQAPIFRPDAQGWPSPLEVIASYVPDYLTRVATESRAVTVGELGFRWYIFAEGWGGGEGGVLKPGYLSFGIAAAPTADGALGEPWRGGTRLGAFFGWGGAKVAYLGGSDNRVLVTRQMQLIPWLF